MAKEEMAKVRPFKGIVYNPLTIKDTSSVLCPPYDIISPEQREKLYHRSRYNFVRIEYSKELPEDDDTNNKYTRAAETLKDWRKKDVFKELGASSIYLHDHYFTCFGKENKRRGITLAVRLTKWEKGSILPHEGTLSAPKADRINILRTLKANTSPILALFSDSEGDTTEVLEKEAQNEPLITTKPLNGESHRIWAISEPQAVKGIVKSLAGKTIYIADGHHRYESALTYQQEQVATSSSATGEELFNFVMMTLVDFADPGLIILSPHRLVRGIPNSILIKLTSQLQAFFEMKFLPLSSPDIWGRVDELVFSQKETPLVLFGLNKDNLAVLKLRDPTFATETMPSHSEIYKKLDVSIIDHIILEGMLGIDAEEERKLAYSYDREDAIKKVLSHEFQLAFLISLIKPAVVKAIADARDRMPRKSTYFYPKAPAGLVFRLI